jgi:hypothetical protein
MQILHNCHKSVRLAAPKNTRIYLITKAMYEAFWENYDNFLQVSFEMGQYEAGFLLKSAQLLILIFTCETTPLRRLCLTRLDDGNGILGIYPGV